MPDLGPTSAPLESPEGDAFLQRIYAVLADGGSDDLPTLLRRREEELGVTETQAARILGFTSVTKLRRLKSREQQKIDALTLVKLSNYLELGVDGVARVLVATMAPEQVAEIEQTRARHFLARTFDLKGLKAIGFIADHNDFDAIAARLTGYFRLDSLFDYSAKVAQPLLMQRRMSFKSEMRSFWTEAVRHQFEQRPNPYPFDRDRLMALMPQVRQYTRHVNTGLLTVAKALYRAGVTVIAQPYLNGTAIHGATFAIDGRPYIVVTDLMKKYPAVWFSLLHELAHVLYDWGQLCRTAFHLSGEADTLLVEDRANLVASGLLMQDEKLRYIAAHIDNRFLVSQFAAENDVHPCIVYWLHARRAYAETGDSKAFAFYNQFINVDPSLAIRALSCHPWDKETISDDIDRVIQTLTST